MKAAFLALSLFLATEAKAVVIDGDTLQLGKTSYRLQGIDAPELDQTCRRWNETPYKCGEDAKTFLEAVIGKQDVICDLTNEVDQHGRNLTACYLNGRDLGSILVSAGHAVAYTRYSTQYLPEQTQAKRPPLRHLARPFCRSLDMESQPILRKRERMLKNKKSTRKEWLHDLGAGLMFLVLAAEILYMLVLAAK